jgi:hypothetical protein
MKSTTNAHSIYWSEPQDVIPDHKKSPGFHAKDMKRHNRLKALIKQHTVSLILFQHFEKDRFLKKRQKNACLSQIGLFSNVA